MKRWSFFIIGLLILITLVLFGTHYTTPTQTEIRAAIDIGSGATNLKVAKVDTSKNKIISLLFEKSIPVPYQKHMEQSADQTFDPVVMSQGIKVIQILKEEADKYHAKKVVAIATAAFRKAVNAPAFAVEIERQTGVPVRIIDQEEEGILAFQGALAQTAINPQDAIVWDIGGGSLQLTTAMDSPTHFVVEKGELASIPFKNLLIQQIQGKDPKKVESPNPVSAEEMQASLQYVQQETERFNPFIKEKIAHKDTKVLAVGSLFNYGILPLVDNHRTFTKGELEKAVSQLIGKSDEELNGGALVDVTVSNPLLILGFMNALHIQTATILNVNNADGALVHPGFWETK